MKTFIAKMSAILTLSGFLLGVSMSLGAQSIKVVTGTVTDSDNNPVPGVNVVVEGTLTGEITDANGCYSIKVPEKGGTLLFLHMGYVDVAKKISGARMDVQMAEAVQELDELIVVGYGTMKKRDISGAITSVKGDDIAISSSTSVLEALQGQVAGLEIVSASGAPGEESLVRVRGTSTFEAGAAPLFVVDGVVYDNIDDLNPDDIASVEVLKDAASAAIYGSRSANGVFLITTKQGDRVPELKVSYSRSYSNYAHKMPVANGAEAKYYHKIRRELAKQRGFSQGYIIEDTLAFFTNSDRDLQDLILRTAIRDEVNLSAGGSTDHFKFYVSLGYLNEDGIVVNSNYNRFTGRINAEYKPNRKLSVSTKAYYSYSETDGTDESGVLRNTLRSVPYYAVLNNDGTYVPAISSVRNPYAVAMTDIRKKLNFKTSVNESLKYTILKGLTLNVALKFDYSLQREIQYRPFAQLRETERTTGRDYTTPNYGWENEDYLSYEKTFNRNHHFNAMLGFSAYGRYRENIRLVGMDYSTDAIYTLNAASEFDIKNTYTRKYKHTMASFFGRIGYNYKGRYIFNANLRYDGSSRFGANNRWGFFPSASVAWRLSDEKFLDFLKPFVTDAKLRASYGITGNESIGDYVSMLYYSPDYIYEDGGQNVAGIAAKNLGYDDLSWEETSQFNVGLDLSMCRSRIRITADYYKKITDKLLNQVKIPQESGFSSQYRNVGQMTNEGVELSVRADIIREKNWKWDVNFNISHNVATVDRLADGLESFYKGTNSAIYIYPGCRLGEFYGYRWLGVFPYDQSNAFTEDWQQLTPVFDDKGNFLHHTFNGEIYTGTVRQKVDAVGEPLKGGDVYFHDKNGDGKTDNLDKERIGCAQPDAYGSVSTKLTWKSLSLWAQVAFTIGGDIYNSAEQTRNSFQNDSTTPSPDAINNCWTKPGDVAKYPIPVAIEHNRLGPNDFYIEDGSYVKLKNVRLTYQFPTKWVKKIWLKGASLYVYGKNLLTFTNYTGYDPEFADVSDPLVMGIDTNRYPRKRELGFGLSLTF